MNGTGTGPVTLMDVARLADVSLATASRALNGSTRRVREDLRERVLLAARKLNYSANTSAQAVARGRSNVVGLIVHDIADPYFSSIAAGVMRAADQHQRLVSLATTFHDTDRELAHLASLRGQRCRAAILVGSLMDDRRLTDRLVKEIEAFEASGGRVVAVSQPRLPVDTVVTENRRGAAALARELVRAGYRSFAILGGPPKLLTARDRIGGFRAELAKTGLRAPVVRSDFTRDGGYAAMVELLSRGEEVECVFAVNDVMAVGAMAACRDHGLVLPRDLALAGFDDIVTLRDVSPQLSTVRLPLEHIGELALELVERDLDSGSDAAPKVVRVHGEVLLRESTPPRG